MQLWPAKEKLFAASAFAAASRSASAATITGVALPSSRLTFFFGARSFSFQPTVIGHASPELKVSCEEVFGPVVTVNAVDSVDEAIELANSTRYGLQAGVFTRSLETALRAARELEFGGITVNEAPTFRSDQMPYGGVKDSGNTREGPHYAVRELTEEHLVVLTLPS